MILALNICAAVGVFTIGAMSGYCVIKLVEFIAARAAKKKIKRSIEEEKIEYIYNYLKNIEK